MATLLKVLNNLADIKSARGVALRVRTQAGDIVHQGKEGERRAREADDEMREEGEPRDAHNESPSPRRSNTAAIQAKRREMKSRNGVAVPARGGCHSCGNVSIDA
jgi:hypothetical protein